MYIWKAAHASHVPYSLPSEDYEAHLATLGELSHKYLIVFKNVIAHKYYK